MNRQQQPQQQHVNQLLTTAATGTGVVSDVDAPESPQKNSIPRFRNRPERNLWRVDEVLKMLELMKDLNVLDKLNNKKYRSENVFHMLEKLMYESGFQKKSSSQICTKWKFLKSTFVTSKRNGIIPKVIPQVVYEELKNMLDIDHSDGIETNTTTSNESITNDNSIEIKVNQKDFVHCNENFENSISKEHTAEDGPQSDLDDGHPIFGLRLGSIKKEIIDSENSCSDDLIHNIATERISDATPNLSLAKYLSLNLGDSSSSQQVLDEADIDNVQNPILLNINKTRLIVEQNEIPINEKIPPLRISTCAQAPYQYVHRSIISTGSTIHSEKSSLSSQEEECMVSNQLQQYDIDQIADSASTISRTNRGHHNLRSRNSEPKKAKNSNSALSENEQMTPRTGSSTKTLMLSKISKSDGILKKKPHHAYAPIPRKTSRTSVISQLRSKLIKKRDSNLKNHVPEVISSDQQQINCSIPPETSSNIQGSPQECISPNTTLNSCNSDLASLLRNINREMIQNFFEHQKKLAEEEHAFQKKQDRLLLQGFQQQSNKLIKTIRELNNLDVQNIIRKNIKHIKKDKQNNNSDINTNGGYENKGQNGGTSIKEKNKRSRGHMNTKSLHQKPVFYEKDLEDNSSYNSDDNSSIISPVKKKLH